jgi:ubiquinone/menaquinone biosynthesis C-methylase UbiE
MTKTGFDGIVDAAYLRKSDELLKNIKNRSYEMMKINPGHWVMDAGCGIGLDIAQLCRLTGENGLAVGIDDDPGMITLANKEKYGAPVEIRRENATALTFDAATFDSVRAERLFQVMKPEYLRPVLNQLIRVLKTSGRLVLLDTDWASASVDYSDNGVERLMTEFFASRCRPNGYCARQFHKAGLDAGLLVEELEVFPVIMQDYRKTPFRDFLVMEAEKAGLVKQPVLDAWVKELDEKNEAGMFFSTVNMTLISFSKP